jgi:hypothetical protein
MSSGISNVISRRNASAILREARQDNPLFLLTFTTSVGGYYLLGCNAAHFGRCPQRFRKNVLPPTSGSKRKQTSKKQAVNRALFFTVITSKPADLLLSDGSSTIYKFLHKM